MTFSETDAGTDTATATFVEETPEPTGPSADDEPDEEETDTVATILDVTADESVPQGEPAAVEVTLENSGDEPGTFTVEVEVNPVQTTEIELDPGERTTLEFEIGTDDLEPGEHIFTVSAGDIEETGTLVVEEGEATATPEETPTPTPDKTPTPAESPDATPTPGETPDATPTPDGTPEPDATPTPDSDERDDPADDDGPGFGPVVTLLGLVGAALIVVRRSQDVKYAQTASDVRREVARYSYSGNSSVSSSTRSLISCFTSSFS